jgi:hypothetical protein
MLKGGMIIDNRTTTLTPVVEALDGNGLRQADANAGESDADAEPHVTTGTDSAAGAEPHAPEGAGRRVHGVPPLVPPEHAQPEQRQQDPIFPIKGWETKEEPEMVEVAGWAGHLVPPARRFF